MERLNNVPAISAKNRKQWRSWLTRNHTKEKSVWLIIFHKKSNVPSVGYDDAVEEALCFGWIDSKPNKRDGESYYLFFAQRKPTSKWSKKNRERAEKMISLNLMKPRGFALIELAKKTGTWTALEDVQNLKIPPDLAEALQENSKAKANFDAFPPSSKRGILEWIANAKKDATRAARISETVRLASQNIRANHYTR